MARRLQAEAWESHRQQAILGAARDGVRPWPHLPLFPREKGAAPGKSCPWLARLASPNSQARQS
eukprot:12066754-Alexandrium_andersonii.AAC.1